MRAYRKAKPEIMKTVNRRGSLKFLYGISLEQFDKILEKQNHCCAVCLKHKDTEGKHFAVDHNHATGEIRGLLCFECNRKFIGSRTDPAVYERAAQYLRQTTGLIVTGRARYAQT